MVAQTRLRKSKITWTQELEADPSKAFWDQALRLV